MNRAERRKAGITAKPKTYVLTDVEIQRIKEEIKKEIEAEVEQRAIDKAFVSLLGIPVLVARERQGYGKLRLIRDVIEPMMGWYEQICDGTVKMQEVLDALREKADVNVTVEATRILVETRAQKSKQ